MKSRSESLYDSAQRSARRGFAWVLMIFALSFSLMAFDTFRPEPVEWRCAIEEHPSEYDLAGGLGILHFQTRSMGDTLGWAYLDSRGNGDSGNALRVRHPDGEYYAMLDLTLRYALPGNFWVDLAAWDADTIMVRITVPDTAEVCDIIL